MAPADSLSIEAMVGSSIVSAAAAILLTRAYLSLLYSINLINGEGGFQSTSLLTATMHDLQPEDC